ncbi:hypothetical protein C9374_003391 [Naegleria lovaniensis]|uniref:Uncharacterized protein n=1 Tax=Naegleria lovaniensis TaxID=51637 RepID=A0AA88GNV6_NAELO|nr:uncharacterized protein C9374_003391 [Naegleria lovaniensis]KAG2385576.1 hypothetical protein C9374_003391 [Naegleria lovaniensis]
MQTPSSPELRLHTLRNNNNNGCAPSPTILIGEDNSSDDDEIQSFDPEEKSSDDVEELITSRQYDSTKHQDPPSPILGIANRNYYSNDTKALNDSSTKTSSTTKARTNNLSPPILLSEQDHLQTLTNNNIYNTNLTQNKWSKLMTPFDLQLTQQFDMKRSFISSKHANLHDNNRKKQVVLKNQSSSIDTKNEENEFFSDSPSKYLEQIQFSQIPASLMIPSSSDSSSGSDNKTTDRLSASPLFSLETMIVNANSKKTNSSTHDMNNSHDDTFQTPSSRYNTTLSTHSSSSSTMNSTCMNNDPLNTSLLGDDLLLDDIHEQQVCQVKEQQSNSYCGSTTEKHSPSIMNPLNVLLLKPSKATTTKKKKSSPHASTTSASSTHTAAPKQVVKIRNNADRKAFERSKNKFESWLKSSPDKIVALESTASTIEEEEKCVNETMSSGGSTSSSNSNNNNSSSSIQVVAPKCIAQEIHEPIHLIPKDSTLITTTTTNNEKVNTHSEPNSPTNKKRKTIPSSATLKLKRKKCTIAIQNDQNGHPSSNMLCTSITDTPILESHQTNTTNITIPSTTRTTTPKISTTTHTTPLYDLYFTSADGLCFLLGEECKHCHQWLEKQHIESNTNEHSGYMTCIHCNSIRNKFKPSLTIKQVVDGGDPSTSTTTLRIVSYIPKNKLLELLSNIQQVNSEKLYENHEELFWNALYHYGSIKECLEDHTCVNHSICSSSNSSSTSSNINSNTSNDNNTNNNNNTSHTCSGVSNNQKSHKSSGSSSTTKEKRKKETSKKKEITQTRKSTKKQLSQKSLFDFMK